MELPIGENSLQTGKKSTERQSVRARRTACRDDSHSHGQVAVSWHPDAGRHADQPRPS